MTGVLLCAVAAGRVLLLVEEVRDGVDHATPSTTQTPGSEAAGTDTDPAV